MRRWQDVLTCALTVILGIELVRPEAQAQAEWRQIATFPTTQNIWGVGFASPDMGFVAASGHELHRTMDGGLTWTRMNVPGIGDDPFYNVLMLDQSLGFCTSNSTPYTNAVYRTTDGGTTWEPTSAPLGGSWYHIEFVSPTVGFAGSNGGCIKSIDQGRTWTLQSEYPTCPVMFSMDFRDANVGLAGGLLAGTTTEGVFKSTDAGKTWTVKYPRGGNGVAWLDDQTAIADDGTGIIRSHDAGETWTRTGAVVATGLSDLTRVTAQVVVGVGFNGTIWYSNDRGTSFSKRLDGIGSLPGDWSVHFSDPQHGWVAGTNGLIYRSKDGGLTWIYVTRGLGASWTAMAAFSERNVIAGGHHGYVAETFDTGNHWEGQIAGHPPEFGRETGIQDMQVLDASTVAAVGFGGSFLKSIDRGRTWREIGYPNLSADYFIFGLEFTDPRNGWIVGSDLTLGPKGYVRRTSDGGHSWQIAEPNVPSIAVKFRGNRGWILTDGDPLWRSQDGGKTWSFDRLPSLDGITAKPSAMAWPTAETGYLCGWFGYLAKSTDGGATWTHLNPHLDDWVNLDITAPTPNEVWVVSTNRLQARSRVMRSLDGGGTWETWTLGDGGPIPTSVLRVGSKCYVCCFGAEVFVLEELPGSPTRLDAGSPRKR